MDLGEAPCQELKYLLWFLYKLSPATGVSGLMTPPRGATDDLPLPAGIDHAIANAQGVGLGVQGGWRRRAAVPRSAPHGGAQHGPRRRAGARRDGSQWPPDAERLRPLQHRERGGSARGDAAHDGVRRAAARRSERGAAGGRQDGGARPVSETRRGPSPVIHRPTKRASPGLPVNPPRASFFVGFGGWILNNRPWG